MLNHLFKSHLAALISAAFLATASAHPVVINPDFLKSKYGFFCHYVWGGKCGPKTRDRNGNVPATFDEMANAFDVQSFANDMAAWNVEYVIFTAWHANINPLFPSETMKKWGLADHSCQRDLIGEVIAALKAKGIKVMLYTHPRDGHDLRGEERLKAGWGEGGADDPDWTRFDYNKWNDFTNDLYAELIDRYGKEIMGLYMDEGSRNADSERVVNYRRLRQTIKSRAPHLVLAQNDYGNLYTCDIGCQEYQYWGGFASNDGRDWGTKQIPVSTCFASNWWGEKPSGTPATKFNAEDMFRYTVLQAGANTQGGGVQWATGPYAGGGWENGVAETMSKLGFYIQVIEPSIKNVHASEAFPTGNDVTLKNVGWGVATDTLDRSVTYLHVLNPPTEKQLRIGKPANGVRFSKASLLTTGQSVKLDFDQAGYLITLPDNAAWNRLDNVIRLETSKTN